MVPVEVEVVYKTSVARCFSTCKTKDTNAALVSLALQLQVVDAFYFPENS